MKLAGLIAMSLTVGGTLPAAAQVQTEVPAVVAGARPAQVERIKVHSAAIEGNLEGETPDREVIVFLPPGYSSNSTVRYPVVYALHGYSIGAEQWAKEIHVPQTIEGAFAKGAREMIVVLPDSKTVYGGSIYSSSRTTGDFESFIAHDLVAYIDAHYRTLADRGSRGLAGHSMGGYGTIRIGMKHPEVFSSLYVMSPGLLAARTAELPQMGPPQDPQQAAKAFDAAVAGMKSPADAANLPLGVRAQLAVAAAWSPNPKKPPLYLDLPLVNGTLQPEVLAKWAANAPLSFIDQYVGNLRRYRAIGLDVGDQDGGREDAIKLKTALDNNAIATAFEIYRGTHTSAVADRFQNHVLPFFSKHLCRSKTCD
ncbi:MAG: alpha/beta fold hydrolase [Pseudomonadota bacterium]